ncbi:hypothetical protein PFISCL1PPCAC_24854, partial [Pristionchus fissidentatus]
EWMEEAGPSGHGYLDGLPSIDDSLYDPSLLYPHFACLTGMGPSASSTLESSSLQPSSFLLSSQSPSLLFSPYKELEWLDRPLRDVVSGSGNEGGQDGMDEEDRKRNWSDRMAMETNEGRCRRMEMNRLRMAEKRARETDEERRERLERAKEYQRTRVLSETEEERHRRKEVNRVRTAIKRGKTAVQRSLEEQLRSMVKAGGGRIEEGGMKEESGDERIRRLELVRQYAAAKRQRETPEKRRERLEKNRDRMRRARAAKKEEWREFLGQREVIEERLRLMTIQLGEKSPLMESDSILATRLTELLKELASAPRKKLGGGSKMDAARSWDRFFSTRLPPLLSSLESLLSSGERNGDGEGEDTFVFGAEASYLDYALFEELDAVCGLSPSVLDQYPTLKGYRQRFQQRLNLTTYALMQAGSTLNLSYESTIDNQSATVPGDLVETKPFSVSDQFRMV